MARREKSKQDTLIDELLKGGHDPKAILGQDGLLKQLTKRLIERTLQAELTDHLGYAPYAPACHGADNCRNGVQRSRRAGRLFDSSVSSPIGYG